MRKIIRYASIALVPDALTSKMTQLTVDEAHWLARKLGVFDGMHEFLHGFCPCQTDLGIDDDEPSVA